MEPQIRSRDELIAQVFRMLDESQSLEWENGSARVFLETMAAWLNETRPQQASGDALSWQLFADALMAGRG